MKKDKQIRFSKRTLGDAIDQKSAQAHQKSRKKWTKIHFSIFIENRNCDLKFVFQFDNENKKRKKKSKFYFILKQKSNVSFDPRIVHGF